MCLEQRVRPPELGMADLELDIAAAAAAAAAEEEVVSAVLQVSALGGPEDHSVLFHQRWRAWIERMGLMPVRGIQLRHRARPIAADCPASLLVPHWEGFAASS